MKAVTGKVITLVITLVIVIVALIVMWFFYREMIPFISEIVQNIIDGITNWICEALVSKFVGTDIGGLICG